MPNKPLFGCKIPCGNCPYRRDAPLKFWSIEEFANLLSKDADQMGAIFECHKQNGSICVGFLINQNERYFPSIKLRMELINHGIGRDYLDDLSCPSPMFETIEEMCEANYPELKEK